MICVSDLKTVSYTHLQAGIVDFLGVNSYNRVLVKPYTTGESTIFMNNKGKQNKTNHDSSIIKGWFETDFDPKAKYNTWGSEIYPDTIYDMLKDIKQMYGDIPVYITESGIGTYDELNAEDVYKRQALLGAAFALYDFFTARARKEEINEAVANLSVNNNGGGNKHVGI